MNALPDTGCNFIKNRFFDENDINDINKEGGDKIFWDFLDDIYEKDPLMEMCNKMSDLFYYKREAGVSLKEYISEFDARVQRAIAKKVPKFPNELLMWLLLEGSNLQESEKRLVMIEVDLKKPDQIFRDTKNSMKKLFSGILQGEGEPTKVLSDTFFTGGQRGRGGAGYTFRGGGAGRGRGGPPRGRGTFRGGIRPSPGYQAPRFPAPGTASGGGGPQGQKNPPLNGKPRFCHSCGSDSHFMAACPDNHGWPAFYAGMCAGQFYEGDGQEQAQEGEWLQEGEQEGQWEGGPYQEEGGQEQNPVYAVNLRERKEEGMIGAAAALHLAEKKEEPKTYYNQFTCLVTLPRMDPSIREAISLLHMDTGCVKSCCGKVWADANLDRMSEEVRKLVRFEPSNAVIRFGEGGPQESLGTLTMPISIGGQNLFLQVEVIHSNIPCLLSNEAMEKVGMIINLGEQSVRFKNSKVPIIKAKTGHTCIKFENFDMREQDEFYAMVTMPEKEKYDHAKLKKIHENLGHPNQVVMEKMLNEAGDFNQNEKEILNKIYKSCATCFIHKKSKARPKVCAPLAHNFNDVVSMDLKINQKHNTIILYLVDMFSKYMAAYVIPDKKPESVIKPFLESWILTRFGAPRAIISDCGGEFVNDKMKALCESFNIRMFTTAGFSAHQNGINERQHATCDEIIKRMMTDKRYKTVRDALGPAVFAKNIRVGAIGYSPHQIVFGQNPRIPGAIDNELPAQTPKSELALIQERLQRIFSARNALSQIDNASRLKMASKVTHSGKMVFVKQGEEVYYRMGLEEDWKGPGRVLGQDGKQIFIRHGRSFIVASPARVFPVRNDPEFKEINNNQKEKKKPSLTTQSILRNKERFRSQRQIPVQFRQDSDDDSESDEELEYANFHMNEETERVPSANQSPATLQRNQPTVQNESPEGLADSSGSPGSPTSPARQDSPDPARTQADSSPDSFGSARSSSPASSPGASPAPSTGASPPPSGSPEESYHLPHREGLDSLSPNLDASPALERRGNLRKRKSEMELSPPSPVTNNQTLKSGKRPMKVNKRFPSSPTGYKYQNERVYPKSGQHIYMHHPEDPEDNWKRVYVVSRNTKGSSSPHGPHFNIKMNQKDQKIHGIYLDAFEWHFEGAGYQTPETVKGDVRNYLCFQDGIEETGERFEDEVEMEDRGGVIWEEDDDGEFICYVEFVDPSKYGDPEVIAAKQKELNHFLDYDVYVEVRDVGQRRITCSWVITYKMIDGKLGIKARLVCNGNQARLMNPDQKIDSPTVKRVSIKIMMTIAANEGWSVRCQDATSAFLQSKEMNRDIFVAPPKECQYSSPTLWRLKRPMYGLDEASYLWYETIKDFMEERGCKSPMNDPAFFYYIKYGRLQGIATTWVDDIFSCGSEVFQKDIMDPLTEKFKFGTFHKGDFKVLGMNIIHRGPDIYLSQTDYINTKIDYVDIKMPPGAYPNKELPEEDKSKVYEAVGKIRWVCDQTRPDLCYEELEMSIVQRSATYRDVKKLNKLIGQALNSNYWIKYSKLHGNRWFLTVFADASLGALPNRMDSAYGYIIFLSEGFNPTERRRANVIDWHCGKVDRVTTSTYEAEAIALREATEATLNLKDMIMEITNIPKRLIDIQAFCDNHHVVSSIFSTKDTCKSKLVIKDIGRMKQVVDRSDITSLAWVPTNQQIADCFTKATASKVDIISTLRNGCFFH